MTGHNVNEHQARAGYNVNERQARALVAYIEAHGGVVTNGNTARALERRGLAKDLGEGLGGGTTFRLTDEGRIAALRIAAAFYRDRAVSVEGYGNAERAEHLRTKAAEFDRRAAA